MEGEIRSPASNFGNDGESLQRLKLPFPIVARGILRLKSARFPICHPLNLTWGSTRIPQKNAR